MERDELRPRGIVRLEDIGVPRETDECHLLQRKKLCRIRGAAARGDPDSVS